MIILQRILNAKMAVLYKLLYSQRFYTAYHYIRLIFKRQDEAFFAFFCMKERLSPHVIKVYYRFIAFLSRDNWYVSYNNNYVTETLLQHTTTLILTYTS